MYKNGIVQSSEIETVFQKPAYVERGGNLVAYQPFMQERTHMRGFFLKGNRDKLQALTDRVFNKPSNGKLKFQPLGNTVLLSFAQIESIYSIHDENPHPGSMSEIDVAFWVPLLSQREDGLHLSWYVAYIFVDNPLAMATGREVYGFPKTMAQFQIPSEIDSKQSYWVETAALRQFRPQSRMTTERIFEVVPRQNGKARTFQAFDDMRQLLPMMMGWDEGVKTRMSLGWHHFRNMVSSRKSDLLFLRQLRDIQNPAVAAYQEVIEAAAKVTNVHRGGWLPGSYEVCFQQNDTFPIAEEMGLDLDGHPVEAAFWVDFDFIMDLGQTIWQAQADIRDAMSQEAE